MVEEAAVAEGSQTGTSEGEEQVSWLDAHENLSDEDRQTLSKYTSQEEAMKGSAHAIRQVGKALHMPDENTSDEDRAAFEARIAEYQGVPKTADAYVLDAKLPEGTEKDEDLDKWFRTAASENKLSQKAAGKLYADWNEIMSKRYEAMETQAKETEDALRKELGKEKFEEMFGVPGNKEKIGQCKTALLHISKEIGADYTDDKKNPQSHLIDDLELVRKNGAIGDKPWIGKAFAWVYQELLKEGVTLTSGGTEKTSTKGGKDDLLSDAWYENPEAGGEEEAGGYGG